MFVAARPIAQWKRKKSLSCVTTRRCKLWVLNGLTCRTSLAGGAPVSAWACWVLTSASWRCLAFRRGAVPAAQLRAGIPDADSSAGCDTAAGICACTLCAGKSVGGPAPSGLTAAYSRNVADAHGRFDLPRESPGRVCNHSPRRYQNSNKENARGHHHRLARN